MEERTYLIVVQPEAEIDIGNIVHYIAVELENPPAAYRIGVAIYDAIESLDIMPERYKIWPSEPWRSRNIHSLPVKNFNILYHVNKHTMTVSILRVFYGRQDI